MSRFILSIAAFCAVAALGPGIARANEKVQGPRRIDQYTADPYRAISEGGICLCKVASLDAAPDKTNFYLGAVRLTVVRTIAGKAHDHLLVPYSCGEDVRLSVANPASYWPPLHRLKDPLLLCIFVPGAVDPSSPVSGADGAMSYVAVVADENDANVVAAASIAEIHRIADVGKLKAELRAAAADSNALVRNYATSAAMARFSTADPMFAMDLLHQTVDAAAEAGQDFTGGIWRFQLFCGGDLPDKVNQAMLRHLAELCCSDSRGVRGAALDQLVLVLRLLEVDKPRVPGPKAHAFKAKDALDQPRAAALRAALKSDPATRPAAAAEATRSVLRWLDED